MKGFLNKGDKVVLRPHFLAEHNISPEHKTATIVHYDGFTTWIVYGEDDEWRELMGRFDPIKDFYVANSINSELYGLLENGLQFVSFTGITAEGKVVEIKL